MSQFAPRKSPLDDDFFGHAPFAERMAASIRGAMPQPQPNAVRSNEKPNTCYHKHIHQSGYIQHIVQTDTIGRAIKR